MPASVHNDQVGSDLFGGVLREQTHSAKAAEVGPGCLL